MVHNTAIKSTTESAPTQKEDKFAKLVGHFGKWQFIVFSSVFLVKLSSGWVQMAILFLTPSYTYWCSEFDGNTKIEVKNSTCYKNCLKYAYDTSPFVNTIISEWDLVCERNWLASFTQMMLQLGILIGSIVFGFLSDRYGRKNTFLMSIVILIAFSFGIPYSPNYTTFTILRFFMGFGTAGTMVISFVIIMETIGPRYRELFGCLFQIPFILGHMTTPLFAYYFRSWDTFSLSIAVPQVIYLGYFFLLSESPRWLISVGKVKEATEIVTQAAIMNNLPTEKIGEVLANLSQDRLTKTDESKLNYSDLFQSTLRIRSVCCCAMWLITGTMYYGFNQYISQTSSDTFVSIAVSASIQIPSNLMSIWLIKILGRKKTMTSVFILGGAFIIALGFVPKIYWLTLLLGSLGVSCAGAAATTLYVYTTELFPTVVRNMGMGACSTFMRIGSMFAPFVSNLSITTPWLPTVIFGISSICAGLIVLLLPETKGKVLPDTIDDIKS
ncbi:organic cation transporter protein-like [Galleria mellonella]|uniref:Organic cation transporter protein-like n=1 Tax=Galleria mellonella TaxID=7137 RepID=A0ABM3MI48_GALME|nr:organic cation transporter protein-like [Galleria mellonella]